jgi:hypothetical protein
MMTRARLPFAIGKGEMRMKKIVKVDLYIKWDDGLEEEISTRLPDGINSDLENYFDFLEEERHEDEKTL